jgi:NADH dehydrogenase
VTDPESLVRAASGCDVVVHLVAIIAGSPEDYERVMAQGTRSLVSAAKAAAVRRFVLMSALGVTEETKSLTPYYGAKWAMEQAVEQSDLEYVIFRPSFVFGPGGGAITEFARLVRRLPAIPVVGSGERRLQPIYVDDVAAFFDRAVDLPEAANRTFELGGPEVVTWNELWARLAKALGKRRPTVHLPVGLLRAQAVVMEKLPKPLVTRDQLTMLEAGDNVCDEKPAAELFGVELIPLDEQLRRSLQT